MSDPLGLHTTLPAPHGGPAFVALTPGATRAVVILHEIFGPQPEIERAVLRFAAQGYAVAAPNLFHQGSKLTCIRQGFAAILSGRGPQVEQVRACRAWLCEQTGLPLDRVALIGFCFGGGFALACGGGWAAISTNYGEIPPAEVMRELGPVIACYGDKDLLFRAKGDVLTARLAEHGKTPEVHRFADAGHAFILDGDHPIASVLSWPVMRAGYNGPAAEDAWAKILAFFDRHLPA